MPRTRTGSDQYYDMIFSLLLFLLVIVLVYILLTTIKPKNFPPGPTWYPVLGCSGIVQYLTHVHGCQWKAFMALAKDYDTKVLGLKLGSELVAVVLGENNVRRVFLDKEFEGRPDSFFIRLRCLGKRSGITFSDGPQWRDNRQFTMKQLRSVGFGRTAMEKAIQVEVISVIDCIKKANGESIRPKDLLATAVMNVLWNFVAGEKIVTDKLEFLLGLLQTRSKAFSIAGGWLNQVPWSRYIAPEWSGYALIKKMNKQISDIIEEAIEKHKHKKFQSNDFISSFIQEMEKKKDIYTEEQLKVICLDLLIAGSQTTSNVLEFALLMALRNKHMQQKIHDEIDEILGDEAPSWNDSSRLIYTWAFLLEVQRYHTIVPLSGPRRVLSEIVMDGYVLPKGCTVLITVADVHNDPILWNRPEQFNPERFINDEGMIFNTEHLYPFGAGRRRCPGDALAKSFVFITFVGILQRFYIECSNGVFPSDEPIIGLLAAPKPYTANFILRQAKKF